MKAAIMIKPGMLLSLLLLAAGCSVLPQPVAPGTQYDFGPAPAASPAATAPRIDRTILLHDAVAPAWMDAPGIHYRLLQSTPAQLRIYANSRWVMPPAALFTNRLKGRLADSSRGAWSASDGLRAELTLRIDMEEFAQWFDGPTASRAVVRVRASLSSGREPAQQKSFSVERPAVTPDAAGGAAALIAASDEAVAQIVDWVAAQKR